VTEIDGRHDRKNHTLYAKWTANTPLLTDDFNDNSRDDIWSTVKLEPAEKSIVEDNQRLELHSASDPSGYEMLYAGHQWH